jgi:acetyltransferase
MSIRNLDRLLAPRSVALIGASTRPRSVGAVLARNLFAGGFKGPVLPVNPHHPAIEGVLAYKSVADLPVVPDLAVISTPPDAVPGVVAALGARGTRAAVVITAGFGEGNEQADRGHGGVLRQALLDAARPHLLRIVGPNCVGLLVPGIGLNASFAPATALAGDLAFVTQSGAVATSVLDVAAARGIGLSHVVSLGDMSDVDFGDLLDFLARDGATRAILLYIEAVTNPRKFMSAARAAARAKPVVVVKSGRHAEGARAAASHTGALAGSDTVYDAAFRRAGLLRVMTLDELFEAVETLARARPAAGDRLAILTNGGGLGVLATDELIDHGGKLAELTPATIAALNAALPPTWSHGNPVDIIGDAGGARYADALAALLGDPGADAVLAINCPVAVASGTEAAEAVIRTLGHTGSNRPVLTSWVGESAAREARAMFARAGLPSYATPGQAVRGFMHLARHRRNRELLMETPPSIPHAFATDPAAVQGIVGVALAAGREVLTEPEAKAVLTAYGIPVVATRAARDLSEAAAAATALGYPVALKILSPDISHKSDVGGVALDLEDEASLRAAAEAMTRRVAALRPEARLEGFAVQTMARRAGAHELILGLSEDLVFGPVVLFGQGGTAVEVMADRAVGLPPLNMALAHEMMGRTRIHRLLRGYRDRPAAKLDEIAATLIKLAQLAADVAEIAELDINPLLADAQGVIALDARIRVKAAREDPARRLAIRPYPRELESAIALPDGTALLLRPIRPEDEPAIHRAFARLSAEDVRLRFFTAMKNLPHALAARLTQIDYDREMALVAVAPVDPDAAADRFEIFGVVRLAADPDNIEGEFAIIVRSDLKGRGLGRLLMGRIVEYARQRGLRALFGRVLRENEAMLDMCRRMGFAIAPAADDPAAVEVRLALQAPDLPSSA